MAHGPNAHRRAAAATPGARQRRPVLAGAGAVRAPLPAPRRPFPGADARDGAVAVPDRSRATSSASSPPTPSVLRLGAALAKASAAPCSCSARRDSRTSTAPSTCAGGARSSRRSMGTCWRLRRDDAAPDRRGPRTLALRAPHPSQPHVMEAISLEVIMATVFGVTDPARVDRLRSATLALLAEGQLATVLPADDHRDRRQNGWDRPFPRIRRAIDAVDAVVLEEVAHRRNSDQLDGDDVLGMFLRTPDSHDSPMTDERDLRRDADAAARWPRHDRIHARRGSSSGSLATPTH